MSPCCCSSASVEAQVHDVERVESEVPQVVVDLLAQLGGGAGVRPAAVLVATGADLRDDVQVVRVRGERLADELVGDVRAVDVGRVDVVDAELDRLAQHGDRRVVVLRRPEDAGAGELHGAVADAGELEVADAVAPAGEILECHDIHCRRPPGEQGGPDHPGDGRTRNGRRFRAYDGPMTRSNALGEYLRARRELVDPADVGLSVAGVRRTPGLRREEVATLAGISADYYLRLEQGRDRNPSAQVLEALARVFGLDATATQYLLDVIGLPAFVESRMFDVLAANRLATALSPRIRPGENRLRSMFLDEDERDLHPEWERCIGGMVAAFRTSLGAEVDDPRLAQLVGDLSLRSELFRQLWARHDVKPLVGKLMKMRHPDVGMLELRLEKLPTADSDGQLLVIYHAEPGSDSARSLALLGSLASEPSRMSSRG
jgi:transcriptional regulator with XRE-family HTH domain